MVVYVDIINVYFGSMQKKIVLFFGFIVFKVIIQLQFIRNDIVNSWVYIY